MGEEQYDKLESALRVLMLHLLKWNHQPEKRTCSWAASVREHRRGVLRQLRKNPGLRTRLDEALGKPTKTRATRPRVRRDCRRSLWQPGVGRDPRQEPSRRTPKVGSRPIWSGASPGRSRNILALPRLVSILRPSRAPPRGYNPILSRPIRCSRPPPHWRRCSSRRGAANGGGSAESGRESFALKTGPFDT